VRNIGSRNIGRKFLFHKTRRAVGAKARSHRLSRQVYFIHAVFINRYLETFSIEGVPKNRINPVFCRIDSVFYRNNSVAGGLIDPKGPLILFFAELILLFAALILLFAALIRLQAN
jgi:hypothetical protein